MKEKQEMRLDLRIVKKKVFWLGVLAVLFIIGLAHNLVHCGK